MNAPRLIASYGRRRGRKLRTGKQTLVDTLLPTLEWKSGEKIPSPLWLEIGFGGGEHLAHQAALNPEVTFLGCEPYVNGFADLLKHIDERKLQNIRIHTGDARPIVAELLDNSVERVFILYPDPWPKARHHKRRLVAKPFIDDLARVMKKGSLLRLATDHADYCAWMLEQLLPHEAFQWTATKSDDWQNPPKDWISTRYEQKALAGRPTYLEFTRR